MTLTEIGLFAGIGGFQLGFRQAGIKTAALVEIDTAAQSVLRRRFAGVPILSDVRACGAHNLPYADILSFGFPCQDLSVAGKRSGLAGARSGLFYEATRIADELRPMLLIWENVPGLLSSGGGRDFAAVLMELERIGYSGCWTTLDAQWFGLAQRRQRVFGVFARRNIGAAVCAEILSLAARLPWNTQTGGAKRERVAVAVTASAGHHGRSSPRGDGSDNLIGAFAWHRTNADVSDGVSPSLTVSDSHAPAVYKAAIALSNRGRDSDVAETLRSDCHGATPMVAFGGNDTRGERAGNSALTSHGSGRYDFESETFVCGALSAAQGGPDDNSAQAGHVIAFTERTRLEGRTFEAQDDLAYALTNPGSGGRTHSRQIAGGFGVRRLTPLECERLQGFPDGWTEGQADSARYRQLGNAVAVPVARWIGQRIVTVLT